MRRQVTILPFGLAHHAEKFNEGTRFPVIRHRPRLRTGNRLIAQFNFDSHGQPPETGGMTAISSSGFNISPLPR